MNQSQVYDLRFWEGWRDAGAVSYIHQGVSYRVAFMNPTIDFLEEPTDEEFLQWTSDENHRHVVETEQTWSLLETLPSAVLATEGIELDRLSERTTYSLITFLEKVVQSSELASQLSTQTLFPICQFLQTIDKEGFRTASD